jgi:hypothetical protein
LEAEGHRGDNGRRDATSTRGISLPRNPGWNVEEDSFGAGAEGGGNLQEGLTVFAAQVGGVDDGEVLLEAEAFAEQIAHGGKNATVYLLIGFVAAEHVT